MSTTYKTAATLPYGSRILTVGSPGVAFIAPSFRIDEAGNLLERMDQLGLSNGAILVPTAATGTTTMQMASTSTVYPALGDEFQVTVRGVAVTFFLLTVGMPEEAGAFKQVECTFREKC